MLPTAPTPPSATLTLPSPRSRSSSLWGWAVAIAQCVAVLALLARGAHPPATVWTLLLIAPWLEELVFRAGLQEALWRHGFGRFSSALLAAAAFAAAHGLTRSWGLALAVLPPALLLGLVYARWRRLDAAVAAHAGMNLFWLMASPLGLGVFVVHPS